MDPREREKDDAERLARFARDLRSIYRVKRSRSPEITQAWLAAEVGRDQTTVSNWLRGHREPSARDVIRLERALGLNGGRLGHHLGFAPADNDRGDPTAIVTTEAAIENDPHLNEPGRELLLKMYLTARAQTLAAMRQLDEELDAETLRQIEEEAAG